MMCPKCKSEIKEEVKFCPHCGSDVIKESDKNIVLFLASIGNLVFILPIVMICAGFWGVFGAFEGNAITYYGLIILFVVYVIGSLVFFVGSLGRLLRPKNKEKTVVYEIFKILVIISFVIVLVAVIIALIYCVKHLF